MNNPLHSEKKQQLSHPQCQLSMKVAVIGAGAAGLIAARELQREAHQVVVFEKSNRVGGIWVYDPRVESDLLGLDPNRDIVHGTLYESMRTNLPREIMSFTDYKFNDRVYDDPRLFPGHEEVLKFLEDFANSFELTELIRFDTEVTRVELIDSRLTEFVVESKTSGVSSEEVFDAVVICNGHNTQPNVATDIPGIETWSKKQMHSHNYRIPKPFQDQIVVIIGSGPSAIEISRDIATVAKEVHVSSRSSEVKVSKLNKYDNIWQHAKIDSVSKNGSVVFQGGFLVDADTIIHCTGYKYHIPFLKISDIIKVEDKRVGPLYKHVFSPKLAPRLSFVGLPQKTILFRVNEWQSRWIAQALSRKVSLPSIDKMLDDVDEYYRQLEEKETSDAHSLEFKVDYVDWIAAQVGIEMEKRIKDLWEHLFKYYRIEMEGYRDAFSFNG